MKKDKKDKKDYYIKIETGLYYNKSANYYFIQWPKWIKFETLEQARDEIKKRNEIRIQKSVIKKTNKSKYIIIETGLYYNESANYYFIKHPKFEKFVTLEAARIKLNEIQISRKKENVGKKISVKIQTSIYYNEVSDYYFIRTSTQRIKFETLELAQIAFNEMHKTKPKKEKKKIEKNERRDEIKKQKEKKSSQKIYKPKAEKIKINHIFKIETGIFYNDLNKYYFIKYPKWKNFETLELARDEIKRIKEIKIQNSIIKKTKKNNKLLRIKVLKNN